MTQIIQLTTSQIASAILTFKGKKFGLDGYLPFQKLYDVDPPSIVAKCSRQVGKTLSIGAIKTSKCVSKPHFISLYVSPLSMQASRFSTMYLDPFLNSPIVKRHFRDSSSKKNVYEKTLTNGSIMFLSYAETELDADRIRGVAADALSVDEVQDVAYDALPILYETLSASPFSLKRHYGTAKSELNTLELLFKQSNGLEWCIKCEHCGRWSIPWTFEDCLKICSGKTGPVCVHCGKNLDVTKGTWLAARPDIKNTIGFHIPRFVLGARMVEKKWEELQDSINKYSPSKLANEVFGLASGIAGRILSQKEAMSCCDSSKTEFDTQWPIDNRSIVSVVMGIDWSVTGGTASYTVISILGYDFMGKCYLLYSERLQGIDILDQVRRAQQLAITFNVQKIGSDRGVGVLQGQLLQQAFGPEKVIMIQYCAAKQRFRYDRQGAFLAADRTQAMDIVFLKMKLGADKFSAPCWNITSTFWSDALSIYEEESLAGRRLYRKDEGAADDWLHSIVFGHLAWMCHVGEIEIDILPPYDELDPSKSWIQRVGAT